MTTHSRAFALHYWYVCCTQLSRLTTLVESRTHPCCLLLFQYLVVATMFQSFFSAAVAVTPSFLSTQVRWMSKRMTKSATKRQPLSPKRAGKGFYKGTGSTKEGHITSKARFVVDPLKRMQLIVPDLMDFKVSRVLFNILFSWCRPAHK